MTFDIRAEAEALLDRLIADRRDLHRHPELAFTEHRTAGIVAERLRSLGYEVTTGVGRTGVVGLLPPGDGERVVMLRFDMDALPIDEANEVEYRSQVPGCMHACGHDGHVAIGLGVAELLARHRERLGGGVKLLFQPAEEDGGGAAHMVADGALEEPRPDIALGLHIWSELPVGMANIRPGPLLSASDDFIIRIAGRGGHGAQPHRTVDTTLVAAQLVVALQSIVSRSIDPEQPAVVTIGTLRAGTAPNIVAEEAELRGTFRTYDEETRAVIKRRIEEIARGIAAAYHARLEVQFLACCPATVSAPGPAALVRQAAEAVLGPSNVIDSRRTMLSEDMSVFLNRVPGCFFFLGGRNEARGIVHPHHSPRFDFDEACLPLGVAILCAATAQFLQGQA